MAKLVSDCKSIQLIIKILDNEFTDIIKDRSDFENYIPFYFKLDAEGETYSFPNYPTFSLYEIRNFLSNLENLISDKNKNKEIETLNFYSSEAYFEFSIYDTNEEGELYIDLWMNLGSMTDGRISGYQKGYRFIVELNKLEEFYFNLKKEFDTIL